VEKQNAIFTQTVRARTPIYVTIWLYIREILNYIAKFKKADKLKSKQSKNGLPEEPILVEDMDTFDSENELTEDNPLLGEDGTILIDGEEEEGEEEEDEEAEHQDELEQNFLNFRFSDEVYDFLR